MPVRDSPSRSRSAFASASRSWWAAQYARQRSAASRCSARRSPNTASQCRSIRRRTIGSLTSSSRRITDTGPSYLKFGAFDLPRRRGATSSLATVVVSMRAAAMTIMKPSPTDIDPLPHRWRNLLPLTGLSRGQVPRHLCSDPTSSTDASRTALGTAASGASAAGAGPFAHQPDHPRAGGAV